MDIRAGRKDHLDCGCFLFRKVKFDHLDKAFCILQLAKVHVPPTDEQEEEEGQEEGQQGKEEARKQNMIRRVDFIVSPPDQFPFALVSWTGSKVIRNGLGL